MGKDLKIKHSVSSSSYKVWGNFFHKKALHGGTNFFWQIFGGIFYMGTNDQIMQGGSYWLKGLNVWFKLVFPIIYLDLCNWYIIWKVSTTNRGLNLKNTFCALCLWGWGFHVKSVFFFKKRCSGDLFFDFLIIELF